MFKPTKRRVRIVKTNCASSDVVSTATNPIILAAPDTKSTAKIKMNAAEVRKFSVKNIKLNRQLENYFSDSESESNNMTNLSENSDGFIKPPSKKIQRLQPTASAKSVPINNKYGILDEIEEMELAEQSTSHPIKKRWIPPIIINSKIGNYKMFSQQVSTILGHGNFRVFYKNTGTKIILQTMEDRDKIIKDFDENKLEFHTFTPNETKTKKIVLKGAPEMDLEEVKDNLKKQGTDIENIIKLKTRRQEESFSYLVTVKKEQSLQDLKKIRNIDQCGIKWEKYSKKNTHTQCYRCQSFGHAESNCHQKPRCVKCPGFHHWKTCKVTRTTNSKAYCHNCGGDHAASYKNCPVLLEYLQKRNEDALNKPTIQPKQQPGIQTRPNYQTREEPTTKTNNTQGNSQNFQTSRSYSDVLKNNVNENNVYENKNTSENEEIGELIELINTVKNIKSELKSCKNQFEKISVIIKYLDKF